MSEIIIAYDVLRVINAKPLFAKDHFTRLKKSALSVDSDIKFNEKTFLSKIFDEINSNKIINGNIKTQIFIDKQNKSYTIESKQIPHHYPENRDYLNGVNTMTYKFTREDPNNKIFNQQIREITDKMISTNQVYEVLYVNSENCLTEGSRSNLFFVQNDELISAPLADILPGVTRKFILQEAKHTGLKLIEKKIDLNEIKNFDAAFISGTSPNILPIKKIDEIEFSVNNPKLRLLMKNFDILIIEDIDSFCF